jgi:hypothetical protein
MEIKNFNEDLELLKNSFSGLENVWDGKASVLYLKENNYNWKQMEWWAFYFEFVAKRNLLEKGFNTKGIKINNTIFDIGRDISWDLKAHIGNKDTLILNDKVAVDSIIEQDGYYGIIVASCSAEYDTDRSFKKWLDELKGGMSKYEEGRIERGASSRVRKSKVVLNNIDIYIINRDLVLRLIDMNQGRNSNGKARKPKYILDKRAISPIHTISLN